MGLAMYRAQLRGFINEQVNQKKGTLDSFVINPANPETDVQRNFRAQIIGMQHLLRSFPGHIKRDGSATFQFAMDDYKREIRKTLGEAGKERIKQFHPELISQQESLLMG